MRVILLFTLFWKFFFDLASAALAEEISATYGAGLRFSLERDAQDFSISIESPPGFNASTEPQVFALQNPDRLVLDLPGIRVDNQSTLNFKTQWTESIRVGKHEDKSRIVLDLKKPLIGQPGLSHSTNKKIVISFRLNEPSVPVSLEAKEVPPAQPEQKTRAGWVEKTSVSSPSAAEKPINLPARSTPAKTPVPLELQQPARNLTGNKVQAYTVKGNQMQLVEIENSKSVSKIPARESEHTQLARLDSNQPEGEVMFPVDSNQQLSEQASDITLTPGEKPLHDKDRKIALKLSPGTQAQPLKEEFINYDHLPPPAKNPFVNESSWAWQLAFGFTLLCLIIVLLKRRSVLQSATLEVVPWFDDSEIARREMYAVLGCQQDCSDAELKERYRQLAKAFHSDKLNASDLPEELRALSEEQFIRVQNAYDSIKKERGIS